MLENSTNILKMGTHRHFQVNFAAMPRTTFGGSHQLMLRSVKRGAKFRIQKPHGSKDYENGLEDSRSC